MKWSQALVVMLFGMAAGAALFSALEVQHHNEPVARLAKETVPEATRSTTEKMPLPNVESGEPDPPESVANFQGMRDIGPDIDAGVPRQRPSKPGDSQTFRAPEPWID